ncbi:MAG: hypothetical protein AAFQ09_04680 [Pseudomonadota bacterium]
MRIILGGATAVVIIAMVLWFGAQHQARSDAFPRFSDTGSAEERGAAAFVGADFGGLSMAALQSHAVPWKLVTAALVLDAVDRDPALPISTDTRDAVLASYGFLVGSQVQNLPEGVHHRPDDVPLGITHGMITPLAGMPVQVANLGCAACHAGVTYRADGRPNPNAAWIGMPNTSLNLEAYTQGIFAALKTNSGKADQLMAAVENLYPDTGWRERQTLRRITLPLVRARLDQIPGDRALPFLNGVPGSTNGVAALKPVFGTPFLGDGLADAGIVSIPDLGHRHWRNSLLADGAYALPRTLRQGPTDATDNTPDKRAALATMTTFFTVPSMGVHPDTALTAVPIAQDIFEFLDKAYTPQPYPAPIDPSRAQQGRIIYHRDCSSCHGTYNTAPQNGHPTLISFPNWLGDVGTDSLRADTFTDELVASFAATPYRDQIAVAQTGAYAAPPLDGIWASAPYLHNGSVPTLWHLLTPETRPDRFELGGHMLDFERLGILLENEGYPADYIPFSTPVLLDTSKPGLGNDGHEFGADLNEVEKAALLEFLKQL